MEDESDSEDDETTLTASTMMAMNESFEYVANFSKYVGNLSDDNYNLHGSICQVRPVLSQNSLTL